MCKNDSSLSCDFTSDVTPFGTYTLRVRTELNGRSSVWIEIECEPLEKISQWDFELMLEIKSCFFLKNLICSWIIYQKNISYIFVKWTIISFSAAVIGAPVVMLQSRRGKMEVDITKPALRRSSFKDVYVNILYRIRYWAEGMREEVIIWIYFFF